MAKIIVSSFSNVTWTKKIYNDSFVQSFVDSLEKCGNDVLDITTNKFCKNLFDCKTLRFEYKLMLNAELRKFKPDLIITFNNVLPSEEFLSKTDCPILIYPADSCDFFANRDFIKKYQDRYFFLNLNQGTYNYYLAYFPFIDKNRIIDFGYCTSFEPSTSNQDINISFLGSLGNYTSVITNYFKEKQNNEELQKFFVEFNKLEKDRYSRIDYKIEDLKIEMESLCFWMMTTKSRFEVLSQLTNLGLKIKGYDSFCDAGIYNYDILRCYEFGLCVTKEQAQQFFNRSKISLNLPNPRATYGFSWRVPDIMATNAALLCYNSPDLHSLMKGYADLPMYESNMEAREIAIKLLKDDLYRQDLVLASNKMINDKCRFEMHFKNLQSIMNINLVDNQTKGTKRRISSSGQSLSELQSKFMKEASKILPYFIAIKILRKLK